MLCPGDQSRGLFLPNLKSCELTDKQLPLENVLVTKPFPWRTDVPGTVTR